MNYLSSVAQRLQGLLLGLLLVVGLFAVVSYPAAAETVQVKMGSDKSQLVFEPATVSIKAGDTVQWVNNKVYPHNIVFDKVPGDDAALAAKLSHKSLLTAPKQTVESAFVDVPAGEYSYFCTPHRGAGMVGKIIVSG
ncbi:MAG: plastocyanin [Cyanobacteriota bacterium]|nr:plastocyanin [Cyanobacteriota bacterium]